MRMLMQILDSILSKLWESFWSKVVERTADDALNKLESIKDFEAILETLQKNLKSLSAKASDIEKEINNAELSGRRKRKREVEEWLEEVRSVEREVVELGSRVESEGFIMMLMEGGTPAKLNEQIDKLVEQSRNFGEIVLDICGTSGETLLTNGMVGIAFNKNLERILEVLDTRQVSCIGVYGMGGVGKTTLAKHVNNQLLKQCERRVIWITVSQEFTVTSLQDKIARSLGVNLSDEDNEDIRATRLNRALSQMKNSVLILDDVWENIDLLKVGCPSSVECCRLIITTRSLEVCRQIRCQEVIRIEKLGEDEAWKLFSETLGNEIELGSQIEDIAKSMAERCGGLPLGIITLAGSMRSETSIHRWKNAFVELNEHVDGQYDMGNDEVYKVLKYSFDLLNRNDQNQSNEFNRFQRCFLYCSLYPEDEEIDRSRLVRKFISEELMNQRKSRRAQVDEGHSILDKLVNVCLLESCVGFFGLKSVKMHDLVRSMALKICGRRYMVRAGNWSLKEIPNVEEWTECLEKVSLMKSGIRRIEDGISPSCPKLTTLLLCGNSLEVISDSLFSKMQRLSNIDLSYTCISILPDSICEMGSLKALLLENCDRLEHVPYLGKLKALRELNLSFTAIKEVPQGLDELVNLKFLSMEVDKLEMPPRGLLLKLGHLQHVNFPLDIRVPTEEIENLKQLQEFSGGVRNVNDFNCFIRNQVHDTYYRIAVVSHDVDTRNLIGEEGFGYSYNNELILCKCNLKDEKVLGQGIVHLMIIKCEGLSICFVDDLPRLNNPTSLKRLRIRRCGGIECILSGKQGSSSQISTLERIELLNLNCLKGVMQKGEIGASDAPAFNSLTRLGIIGCNKMRKLGLPISAVPILKIINIQDCGEIEEIFEDEGSLTLPKLERLKLEQLPKLKSVCKETMICNSIIGIRITKCPRLTRKLPVHVDHPPPPTLMRIDVEREWWETLEWDNPSLPLRLHPLLHCRD